LIRGGHRFSAENATPEDANKKIPIMPLHLIKLCVGCDSVKDLQEWIRERLKDRKKRGLPREHVHTTRMVPKRADELLDGGSLFWVIRGEVLCRQRLDRAAPGAKHMPETLRRELRELGLL
jgi:hypothetical protein